MGDLLLNEAEETGNESSDEEYASERTIRARMSEETLNQLNEMRTSNTLTDGTITVTGATFPIHRAVLSSCSSYFR